MSYQLRVLKDHPIGFWPLDESSGTVAYDASPCGNNSEYSVQASNDGIPLVSGGSSCTKIDDIKYITYSIDKNYYGNSESIGFGTKTSSDNDFTIEIWTKPKVSSSSPVPLFASASNSIGLYYLDGSIAFYLQSNYLIYRPLDINRSMHIVGVYRVDSMELYVDGELCLVKKISDFSFSNTTTEFTSGPTSFGDYLLIDAPAVYRYALSKETIRNHYLNNAAIEPTHIVGPDGGSLLEPHDNNIGTLFRQAYPTDKSWEFFSNDNLVYDSESGSLLLRYSTDVSATNKEAEIVDLISLPYEIFLLSESDKIEWSATTGVNVYISYDNETYVECTNGAPLNLTSNQFYIKVTFSSINPYLNNARISYLSVKIFSSDIAVYSKNSGAYLSNISGATLLNRSDVLSHDDFNGIKCAQDGTFDIYESFPVNALEFIYTPFGTTKTRAEAFYPGDLYVNGQLNTGTDMSTIFAIGNMYHVVINTDNIEDLTDFNFGGDPALFQNIALYDSNLTIEQIQNHYSLYTGKPSILVSESVGSVTENSFKAYNNDWLVIQNS